MPMASLGSLEALRELNRLRVIDALRRRARRAGASWRGATGLSRTTITTLVTELQGRGLVVEQPPRRPSPAGRGRPPILLRLDPSAGAVARHPLRPPTTSALPWPTSSRPCSPSGTSSSTSTTAAAAAFDAAAELVDAVLAEAGSSGRDVVGVGDGALGADRRSSAPSARR